MSNVTAFELVLLPCRKYCKLHFCLMKHVFGLYKPLDPKASGYCI